jgi:pimeloyl-ACP methyl ester carboxylesterase
MKPAIILIHGAGLNGASWDPVRRHLDPRFNVITPDLPGHGSRIGEPFTLAGAVATVAAAAKQAGPVPLLVGGDSLGGYTSAAAASALPSHQLKGLVLSGCTANLSGFGVLLPFRLKGAMIRLMSMLMSPARIDKALAKQFAAFGLSPEDTRAIMAAGANPGIFPQAVAALKDVDFRSKVATIEQPVLFVNGGLDKIFVRQEAAFIAVARAPQQHRFAQSEHGVSLLRSREFAGLVNDFARPLLGLGAAQGAAL